MMVDLSEFIMSPRSTKVVYSSTSILSGIFILYGLGNGVLQVGEDQRLHELSQCSPARRRYCKTIHRGSKHNDVKDSCLYIVIVDCLFIAYMCSLD